jgi:hypothetical protein
MVHVIWKRFTGMGTSREEEKTCGIGDGAEEYTTRGNSSDGIDHFINGSDIWSIIERFSEGVKMQ